MDFVTVRGLQIATRVIGGSGPWMAFVPGGRRGHEELVPLAEKIAAKGFRVLLHDRRNTGLSAIRFEGDDTEETVWADDLAALLDVLGIDRAFIGGSSSGARVAMLFALRHARYVRGLLLMRVTGGPFAAQRLPENYYGEPIRAAEEGGMAAVCALPQYAQKVAADPAAREQLLRLRPEDYVAVLSRWRERFSAVAGYPVMGVTDAQLRSIRAPTVIIPGNDQTHSHSSALAAHERIPGSVLHDLKLDEADVPLIPFEEWASFEPEIADVFAAFMMRGVMPTEQDAT